MTPQPENFRPEAEQEKTAPREKLKPATPTDQLGALGALAEELPPEAKTNLQKDVAGAAASLGGNLSARAGLETAAATRLQTGITRIAGPQSAETAAVQSRGPELQKTAESLAQGEVPIDEVVARVAAIEAEVLANQFKYIGLKEGARGMEELRKMG